MNINVTKSSRISKFLYLWLRMTLFAMFSYVDLWLCSLIALPLNCLINVIITYLCSVCVDIRGQLFKTLCSSITVWVLEIKWIIGLGGRHLYPSSYLISSANFIINQNPFIFYCKYSKPYFIILKTNKVINKPFCVIVM